MMLGAVWRPLRGPPSRTKGPRLQNMNISRLLTSLPWVAVCRDAKGGLRVDESFQITRGEGATV